MLTAGWCMYTFTLYCTAAIAGDRRGWALDMLTGCGDGK